MFRMFLYLPNGSVEDSVIRKTSINKNCGILQWRAERLTVASRQSFWLIFDNFLTTFGWLPFKLATVGGGDVNCQNANVELDISASRTSCILLASWNESHQKVVKKLIDVSFVTSITLKRDFQLISGGESVPKTRPFAFRLPSSVTQNVCFLNSLMPLSHFCYDFVLEFKFAFDKYSNRKIDSLGVLYDYYSVMHYGAKAFSKNGQPTIVARQPSVKTFGNIHLSVLDIKQANLLYKCPG